MAKKLWDYDKRGRLYKRGTGTIRYPDTGEVFVGGRKVSTEKTHFHKYGYDKGFKRKKPMSKVYKPHTFISHGKRVSRGGYRRGLV